MKITKSFYFLISSLILVVFLSIGCDTSESDSTDSSLVGTWDLTKITMTFGGQTYEMTPTQMGYTSTIVINSDGTYSLNEDYGMETYSETGTWSVSGNNFTVNPQDGESWTGQYNVSGNKFTITVTETDPEIGTSTIVLEYTKR